MASQTVKLQTNIPVIGTLKYADLKKSDNPDWADQIAVRGDWGDPPVDGRVYLPLACEGQLQTLGVIGSRQDNGNFKVLMGSPRIKISRTEEGGKKRTNIELISSGGTRSAPPASTQQNQPPRAQFRTGDNPSGIDKKAGWESLILTMKACIRAANDLWKSESGEPVNNQFMSMIASSLFSASVSMGLLRTPPAAAAPPPQETLKRTSLAQMETIAKECLRLNQDEAWLSKTCASYGYPPNLDACTEAQADSLIESLKVIPTPAPVRDHYTEDIPF